MKQCQGQLLYVGSHPIGHDRTDEQLSTMVAWILLLAVLVSQVYALNISVQLSPASSPLISLNLVGFSLKQDRRADWAGSLDSGKNTFFYNARTNLAGFTGQPSTIRIGANSELAEHNSILLLLDPCSVGLGSWRKQCDDCLLDPVHLEAFASSAVKNNIILEAFEIGNEADLYPINGLRGTTYPMAQYVADWTALAKNVTATAGLTKAGAIKFWGCAFGTSSGFSPRSAFTAGLLASTPGLSFRYLNIGTAVHSVQEVKDCFRIP
ncbi:hypothetical protein C8J56DRAFT_10861 [Mycena floridula]|nr:hypothetical protein C8J56DRAFT_10861 [Mycena floridula]